MNPNSDRKHIDNLDLSIINVFPKLTKAIELKPFRHIKELLIKFDHPISVISGTNRSGKSTILMALACSHFNFQKRNPKNGKLERQTWSSLMKFTSHDNQTEDWTYKITYKTGSKIENKRGQRKKTTKKWNGIGKKESQFKDRQAIFIDLDRIVPARFYNEKIHNLANNSPLKEISRNKKNEIQHYISYILEEQFELKKLAEYQDKDIFRYGNTNQYSSYNAASGEDVLTRLIIDIVEAESDSLILIDEIELGLHPKVQNRLIDVMYNISKLGNKQFVITTHSATILASLPEKSRIFIEKKHDGSFKAIQNISVNAALTKMDSNSYPLVDLYCEDIVAEHIIKKAIGIIEREKKLNDFSRLINIIISGSAKDTYENFKSHQRTYNKKKIKCGYACVLDGDVRDLKENKNKSLSYPPEDKLHFLYSNKPPEIFLVSAYLNIKPNRTIQYHLNDSDVHCLFDKVIENSDLNSKDDVFLECWNAFINTVAGKAYIKTLKEFILNIAKQFSLEL